MLSQAPTKLDDRNITLTVINKLFLSELGENLCNGIPPWFFNFWWRFINLQDEKTAILKLPMVLQHTTYKIAVPLTISTSLLNLLIHALRSKNVIDLLKQRDYKHACKSIGIFMINEAKNPDTVFNALYSFGTCVSWTLGNATTVWMASSSVTDPLASAAISMSGAISGYVIGACAVGGIWWAGTKIYRAFSQHETITLASVKTQSWNFIKNNLIKELPGLAVCSGTSSLNLSTIMVGIPEVIQHFLDASIVASASSFTNCLQMASEKICWQAKSKVDEAEKKPLLEKDMEKGENKSNYQSKLTIFEAKGSIETSYYQQNNSINTLNI